VLVKELKTTIDQQNKSIKEAQTELKELKEDQQQVKEQNNELKDEVCMLQAQVSTLSTSLPSTQSWASIAADRSGQGSTQRTPNDTAARANNLARYLPTLTATTDTLYRTIDTSRVAEEDSDKTSPGIIRAVVEREIRATNGQSNWRCRAAILSLSGACVIRIHLDYLEFGSSFSVRQGSRDA
jgi:chromosome segregation ATPase